MNSDEIPQYTDLQPLGAPVDAGNSKLILNPQDLLLTTHLPSQVDSILSQFPNTCKIIFINNEIQPDGKKVTLDDILVSDLPTNTSQSVSPVQQVPTSPLQTASPQHESIYSSNLYPTKVMSPDHT